MKKILVFLVFIFCHQTFALSYTWMGTVNTAWSNASNWSPNGVPSSADDVTINDLSSATNMPMLDQNRTIKSLTLAGSRTLNLATFTLTITTSFVSSGGAINNGKLIATSPINLALTASTFSAQLELTGNNYGSILQCQFANTVKIACVQEINNNYFGTTLGLLSPVGAAHTTFANNTVVGTTTISNKATSTQYISGNTFIGNVLLNSDNTGSIHFTKLDEQDNVFINNKVIALGAEGFSKGSLILESTKFDTPDIAVAAENILTLTGTSELRIKAVSFGNKVNFKAPSVYLYSGTFASTALIEQTGSAKPATPAYAENLVFNGPTTLRCSGASHWDLGNESTSNIVFKGSTTLATASTGRIRLGLKGTVQFLGNVVNSANDPFRDNYGTVIFNGSSDQQLSGNAYKFTNFSINKPGKSLIATASIEFHPQLDASLSKLVFAAGKMLPQSGATVTFSGGFSSTIDFSHTGCIEGVALYTGFGNAYIPLAVGSSFAMLGINNTGTVNNTFTLSASLTDTYINNATNNTLVTLEKCYFINITRTHTSIANDLTATLFGHCCNAIDNYTTKRALVFNYSSLKWEVNQASNTLGIVSTNTLTIPAAETRALKISSGNFGRKITLNTQELPKFKMSMDPVSFPSGSEYYSSVEGSNSGILELTPNNITSGKQDFIYHIYNPNAPTQTGQLKVTLDANYSIVASDGLWLKPYGKSYVQLVPEEHYVIENNKRIKILHLELLEALFMPSLPVEGALCTTDLTKNFSDSYSYDEFGNLTGATRVYTDAFGKALQTQTINAADQKVVATQQIYDKMGRLVVSTLPVVLNTNSFCYQSNLAVDASNTPYASDDFEKTAHSSDAGSLNNPNPIGGQGTAGTLGWYYSSNNTMEPYTPTSTYPFYMMDHGDRSGGVIGRVASPGNALKMGSGKESMAAILPVFTEMADYLQKRHYYVPSTATVYDGAVGLLTKNILKDANGKQVGLVKDPSGLTLASFDIDTAITTPLSVTYGLFESNYRVEMIGCGGAGMPACVTSNPSHVQLLGYVSPVYQVVPEGTANIDDEVIKAYGAASATGPYRLLFEGTVKEYNETAPRLDYLLNTNVRIYMLRPNLRFKTAFKTQEVALAQKVYVAYQSSQWAVSEVKLKYAIIPSGFTQYYAGAITAPYYGPSPCMPSAPQSVSLYDYFYLRAVGNRSDRIDALRVTGANDNGSPLIEGQSFGNHILVYPLNYDPYDRYDKTIEELNAGAVFDTPWKVCDARLGFPVFLSDEPFELVYNTGPSGQTISTFTVPCAVATLPDFSSPSNYVDIHVTSGRMPIDIIAKGGSVKITNLTTGALAYSNTALPLPPAKVSPTLPVGFYRASFADGDFNISYKLHYKDFNYHYYDDKGQLIVQVSPKGVVHGNTAKPSPIFTTTYVYDSKGQLLSKTDPDKGTIDYVYRTDGMPTLSQNAQQKLEGKCSYVNYDAYLRPIEVGEYNLVTNGKTFATMLQWEKATYTGTPLSPNTAVSNTGTEKITYAYSGTMGILSLNNQTYTRGKLSMVSKGIDFMSLLSYDAYGRLEIINKAASEVGNTRLVYTYTGSGALRYKCYDRYMAATEQTFKHAYVYDAAGRPQAYFFADNLGKPIDLKNPVAAYSYYKHGGLKRKELGGKLQGVDYLYTLQGWLKGINMPPSSDAHGFVDVKSAQGFQNDLFTAAYDYYPSDYSSAALNYSSPSLPQEPLYDGTLRSVAYAHNGAASSTGKMFVYKYDNKYQLAESFYGAYSWSSKAFTSTNARTTTGISYDAHGNLNTLRRLGADGVYNAATSDYLYTYSGNRLTKVEGGLVGGVRPLRRSYAYDALGRMTYELNGTAKYYSYNSDDQVTAVYADAAKTKYIQSYIYDEAGALFALYTYAADGTTIVKKTWYFDIDGTGPIVYTQDVAGGGTIVQEQVPLIGLGREGLYHRVLKELRYEIGDHLGNVRSTFRLGTGSSLMQLSLAEYDPYGNVFNATVSSPAYLYGYQGQFAVWDGNLKENRFDLRSYDPEIGRWKNPDPYDEFHSPYVAMGNDFVNEVDPTGGAIFDDGVKVGAKAATMTTMKTYTVGAKISNAMAAAVSGTFSAFSSLDNMFGKYDNGAAAGDFIAGLVPVKAIVNTVTYATSGTDYKGDKLSGGQVALDIALELPILKTVKYVKKGKFIVSKIKPPTSKLPDLGSKLKYVFGKATGELHNIERSKEMLRQLKSIGIFDNEAGNAYIRGHLGYILNKVKGVAQSNGRVLRESILMGPNGALKMESIWEGDKLITIFLFGR